LLINTLGPRCPVRCGRWFQGFCLSVGESSTAGPETFAIYPRTLDCSGHLRECCHGYYRGAVCSATQWNGVYAVLNEPRDYHAANTRGSHVPRGLSLVTPSLSSLSRRCSIKAPVYDTGYLPVARSGDAINTFPKNSTPRTRRNCAGRLHILAKRAVRFALQLSPGASTTYDSEELGRLSNRKKRCRHRRKFG
jgi:hypothetical protein